MCFKCSLWAADGPITRTGLGIHLQEQELICIKPFENLLQFYSALSSCRHFPDVHEKYVSTCADSGKSRYSSPCIYHVRQEVLGIV